MIRPASEKPLVKGSTLYDVQRAADEVLRILRSRAGTRLHEQISLALIPLGGGAIRVTSAVVRDGIKEAVCLVTDPSIPTDIRKAVSQLDTIWFDFILDAVSNDFPVWAS